VERQKKKHFTVIVLGTLESAPYC